MAQKRGAKQKSGWTMAEKVESPLAKNESAAVAILESVSTDETMEIAILELEPMPDGSPSHDEIAALAYSYWEARGCQDGSPEGDWFRAERKLRSQRPIKQA